MKVKSADSYFRLANDPAFAQEMSERQRSLSGSVRKSWPGTMLSAVTADVDPGKGRSANVYKRLFSTYRIMALTMEFLRAGSCNAPY